MFGISELAIVLIIFIVIFSAKKLPDLARSLGKSARILKSEAKAMKSDQAPSTAEETSPPEAPTTRIIRPRPVTQPALTTPCTRATKPHGPDQPTAPPALCVPLP